MRCGGWKVPPAGQSWFRRCCFLFCFLAFFFFPLSLRRPRDNDKQRSRSLQKDLSLSHCVHPPQACSDCRSRARAKNVDTYASKNSNNNNRRSNQPASATKTQLAHTPHPHKTTAPPRQAASGRPPPVRCVGTVSCGVAHFVFLSEHPSLVSSSF